MRSSDPGRRKLARIHALLVGAYGDRTWCRSGSAVDVLVRTILSQNTSGANSSAGYRRLRERFPSWEAAADARVADIERCIRVSGLSRVKAPRIRRILYEIRRDRGRCDLEFLRGRGPEEAYDYLVRFEGVGPKTANCVLLFAFGMAVFPVDTHVRRLARRLGLAEGTSGPAGPGQILTALIPPAKRYSTHLLLIAHGRRTCRARNPKCDECVLARLCPRIGVGR